MNVVVRSLINFISNGHKIISFLCTWIPKIWILFYIHLCVCVCACVCDWLVECTDSEGNCNYIHKPPHIANVD